jgi:predicted RNase H-like nuclease (RuvC/YqgF family)
MAIEKKYITLNDLDDNQIVSTKLYVDQYNQAELEKAVDIKVTELINALPDVNLDLVPKPVYDAEVSHSKQLELDITKLELEITDLTAKVQALTSDSSSLYISNDNLRVTNAKLENTVSSVQQTTLELRLNLTTSLTKALNEATERTTLEAENNGLNAQKNALIKQIDTLNNLLAQANASLQVAAQQLSAKSQAVAGGGLSTGELATIVFDGGDPTKKKVEGKDLANDYNGGPFGVKDKFSSAGDPWKNNNSTYSSIDLFLIL